MSTLVKDTQNGVEQTLSKRSILGDPDSFVNVNVTQTGIEILYKVKPDLVDTQDGVEVLAHEPSNPVVTQTGIEWPMPYKIRSYTDEASDGDYTA